MLFRIRVLAWTVLVLAAAASTAAAQTTLRYQFKEGDSLPYVVEQKIKMTMSIGGMDIDTKMNVTVELSLKVVEKTRDGAAKIEVKVNHATVDVDSLTGKVKVDSKDKNVPDDPIGGAISGLVKAMGSMEMTATMLPTGEMKDFKVSDATVKAVKNIPGAAQLGDIANPDTFKSLLGSITFPADAVAKGKTWSNKTEAKTAIGKSITENTYTYEGTIQKDGATLEKLSLKPDMKIEVDPKAPVKLTVKGSKGSGQVLFDNKAGKIVEVTTTQTTEMQVAVMGLTVDQTVQQSTTLRLKK